MSKQSKVTVFGEVLFDCFPTGEQILGGAPFNVAWHLQALGDQPQFISRVGNDELGQQIIHAIEGWGLDKANIQTDPVHETGHVDIDVVDNEPHYRIAPDCAYDFIDSTTISDLPRNGILYHGSLGLRNQVSRDALMTLAQNPALSIFIDVNLRPPWWQKEEVHQWLSQARWAKLNQDELQLLGYDTANIEQALLAMQAEFQLEQVILTRSKDGAIVCSSNGEFHRITPTKVEHFVDTVGAGDAFTAVYIHGLLSRWSITDILSAAQQFASKVIGLRGATSDDPGFYPDFGDRS